MSQYVRPVICILLGTDQSDLACVVRSKCIQTSMLAGWTPALRAIPITLGVDTNSSNQTVLHATFDLVSLPTAGQGYNGGVLELGFKV